MNSYYLPKFNKFDKSATIETFYQIFYPEYLKSKLWANVAKTAALTLLGIGALIGVEYLLSQSGQQNNNKFRLKKTPEMIKKRRVYRLYKDFNRNRNSSIFLKNLTPVEVCLYNNYILANY